LTVGLGTGGDTFTDHQYQSATTTTVNGGRAPTTFTVDADSSTTHLTGGGGADHFNIQPSARPHHRHQRRHGRPLLARRRRHSAANVIGIQAALSITGAGSDTVTVDDSGSSTTKTGALSATAITGLG